MILTRLSILLVYCTLVSTHNETTKGNSSAPLELALVRLIVQQSENVTGNEGNQMERALTQIKNGFSLMGFTENQTISLLKALVENFEPDILENSTWINRIDEFKIIYQSALLAIETRVKDQNSSTVPPEEQINDGVATNSSTTPTTTTANVLHPEVLPIKSPKTKKDMGLCCVFLYICLALNVILAAALAAGIFVCAKNRKKKEKDASSEPLSGSGTVSRKGQNLETVNKRYDKKSGKKEMSSSDQSSTDDDHEKATGKVKQVKVRKNPSITTTAPTNYNLLSDEMVSGHFELYADTHPGPQK